MDKTYLNKNVPSFNEIFGVMALNEEVVNSYNEVKRLLKEEGRSEKAKMAFIKYKEQKLFAKLLNEKTLAKFGNSVSYSNLLKAA